MDKNGKLYSPAGQKKQKGVSSNSNKMLRRRNSNCSRRASRDSNRRNYMRRGRRTSIKDSKNAKRWKCNMHPPRSSFLKTPPTKTAPPNTPHLNTPLNNPLPTHLLLSLIPPTPRLPIPPKNRRHSLKGKNMSLALVRGFSSQKKALLRLLFKMTSVDGESVEDPRYFPKAPGVITWIRDTGRGLNGWHHLWGCEGKLSSH